MAKKPAGWEPRIHTKADRDRIQPKYARAFKNYPDSVGVVPLLNSKHDTVRGARAMGARAVSDQVIEVFTINSAGYTSDTVYMDLETVNAAIELLQKARGASISLGIAKEIFGE